MLTTGSWRGKMTQRPENFWLRSDHPYAQGLKFAQLGNSSGGLKLYHSSPYGLSGSLIGGASLSYDSSLNRKVVYFDNATSDTQSAWLQTSELITGIGLSYAVWCKPKTAIYGSLTKQTSGTSAYNREVQQVIYPPWQVAGHVGIGLGVGTNGIVVPLSGSNNAFCSCVSYQTVSDWNHFAVTTSTDGRSHNLYLNGVTIDSGSTSLANVYSTSYLAYEDGSFVKYFNGYAADFFLHQPSCIPSFFSAFSDPGNVDYDGLIYAPRVWWPSVVVPAAPPGGFQPAWATRRAATIGGAVI